MEIAFVIFNKNSFKRRLLLFLMVPLAFACSNKEVVFIDSSNSHIAYEGRVASSKIHGTALYWSGTSIEFTFEGESIAAVFKDETGDNYYNVIIDNDSLFILRPSTTKESYELASNLSKGKHTVEIFKRTEFNRGKTSFYGFQIKGNPKLVTKQIATQRKIEFFQHPKKL